MRGWATAERARLEARINGAHAVRCMNPVEVWHSPGTPPVMVIVPPRPPLWGGWGGCGWV